MEATQTTPSRWVSYEEAGRRFGVSRWTLRRWARAGHVQIARAGGIVRIDAQSVEQFLARCAEDFE